ncbi:MAG: PAS domain S-box protein [Candidatus Altiarchaeia archaeon]
MDIRSKTFAVLALVFLCIMGAVYFSAENLLFKGFESVEISDMQVNTYRVYSVLSSKYSALEVMTGDWATSNEAYEFLENRDAGYIKENLDDKVFETNRINLILFYNASGSILWGKAYDYKKYEELPIPDSLLYMQPNDPLIKLDAKDANTGILVTSSGPMYISSKPVLTVKGEGPPDGTLIIGRFLDAEERGDISWITGLPVSIYAVWDKDLPPDYKDARTHISDESPVYVRLTGNASLNGYGVIKDVYGKAAMIYRTESPRTVYPVGKATTRDLLVLVLLSSVFSWLVMLFFFDRTVLFRLSKIVGGVMKIGETGNLETRISDKGKDELNDLAGAINTMLSRINDSEKALKTSEEKYHSLVDNINDVIYALDKKGYFIYVSPTVERLFGYKTEQIIGIHFSRFIYPEDLHDLMASFEKVLAGKLEPYEFRMTDISGSIHYIRSSSRAIIEKDNVRGISGILTDVTERKKAEASLKQSEEKYHSLVDNINDVIYTLNEKGKFTYVSPAVKRALKYEPREIIGKSFSDIAHPDDLQGMIDNLQRTLLGEFEPYEFRVIDGAGATRYLRSSGKALFERGVVKGITGIFTDVTARRKAENELLETTNYLESLINSANAPIIVWDQGYRITRFNRAFEYLTGYTAGEVIGKDLSLLFPKEKEEESMYKIARTLKEERWESVEISIQCKNGEMRLALWNSAHIYDKDGKTLRATIAQGVDITERKYTEKRLSQELNKFKVLYDLALNMSEKTLEENLRFIVEKSREILSTDTAYIGLCDDEYGEVHMHTVSGIRTESFKQMKVPYGKELGGLVMQTRRGYIVDDYFKDKKISHPVNGIISDEGLLSGMAVPIQAGPTNLGVLYVFNREKTGFTGEDLATLTLLGNLAAVEITNKRSQQALQDSKQRLADIIDFLPDAMFVIDGNGRVIAWNKAIEELTGLKADDIVGRGDYDYALPFYGKKRPLLIDLIGRPGDEIKALGYAEVERAGDTLFAESRSNILNPGKGEETVLWLKASPLFDRTGRRVGSIESMRDVTEREKAENALQESESRLMDIIDFLPDATFVIDGNGRVIAWNKAIEKMTGVKAADILGKGDYEYALPFYEERNPILADLVLKPDASKKEIRYGTMHRAGNVLIEESYVKKLGMYLSSVAVALYDSEGNITGAIESIRDITERNLMEEALSESEQKFRTLFNSASDTIFIYDLEGKFIEVNDAACDKLGFTREQILRMSSSEIEAPEYGELMHQRINEVLEKGRIIFESGHVRRDGRLIPVEINSRAIEYSGKKAVLSIARDITERKKAEEKLKEYSLNLERMVEERTKDLEEEKNRVQELLNFKTQFMNQLSHDLRTPLTPMMALMPLLEPHITNERDKERFHVINNNIQYMRNLVVSILDIARMDAGRFTLNKTKINLYKMVENIISDTMVVFEKSNITSINRVPENIYVYADELHIKEVFENLISNSIRYSPAGGTITLAAAERENAVEISVTDTGIGMEKTQISGLFTEFFKADTSRHDPYSTGLGLSICKRIVEKHGGRINASSNGINKGMTISFTLPKEKTE